MAGTKSSADRDAARAGLSSRGNSLKVWAKAGGAMVEAQRREDVKDGAKGEEVCLAKGRRWRREKGGASK